MNRPFKSLLLAGTDYTPFDELVLVFTPGGPRILCEPFFVRVDGDLEGTEVVTVSLTSVDLTIGPRSSVVIIILDSDREFVSPTFALTQKYRMM